jgi:citrate synthase
MLRNTFTRRFSSSLKSAFESKINPVREQVVSLRKNHGKETVASVTVEQVINGMRDIPCMFYLCSALDPHNGIRLRDYSIPELQEALPKIDHEPLPEATFWLLLTGEVPTQSQVLEFQEDLSRREAIPQETQDLIRQIAKTQHPMTALSMGIMHLQKDSKFANAYGNQQVKKGFYWDPIYEDSLDLIAKLPGLAALIYTEKYGRTPTKVSSSDWAGKYSELMGFDAPAMKEILRGYLSIHSDHEGGNVSAHTNYLVGSALADPYLSYSAALNGLAGPLHGLANQEVLRFLLTLDEHLKSQSVTVTNAQDPALQSAVSDFVNNWLKTGVVPGYGHAVLRSTDPRFVHQKRQAERWLGDDRLVKLVHTCEVVVPQILGALGKVKNPFPNVDAHSGVLLYSQGLTEFEYYTVVFGVSRALGCLANTVWARALGLPIERPGSLTIEGIKEKLI